MTRFSVCSRCLRIRLPRLGLAPLALLLALPLVGCRSKPRRPLPGPAVPLRSDGLPGSVTTADAPAPPHSSPTPGEKTYTDSSVGVRFSYPPSWTPSPTASGIASPAFRSVAGPAKISLTFLPAATAFAGTNLAGLRFSYTAKSGSSLTGCEDIAANSPSGTGDISTRSINGITYSEGHGEDSGMCHQVAETVDTTLQKDQCIVFERDTETVCPGIEGSRPHGGSALTSAQRAALQHQLDSVMNSVAIGR